MSDFVNTVDIVDDNVLIDSIIDKSISGSFNDNKITGIRAGAFAYCTNLESVCFPNVTRIGPAAFRGSGLKAITPETFPLVTSTDYYYGSYVFGESALESVDWPSLTKIGDYLFFANCKSLKSVNLPNLTTFTGTRMFDGCTSLKDVNLPVITKCPGFAGCTSLETITLPCVTNVGGQQFNNCTSLRVIDLPSCTSIGYHSVFKGSPLLDTLILRSTTMCTLSEYDNGRDDFFNFSGTGIANGTGYIYVPAALVDSYKVAENWSTYANQFRALEDYTVDGTTTGELDETKI